MTDNSGALRRNQNLHESLVMTLRDGESGLKAFPGLLLKVIQEESWRERYVAQLEQVVTFKRFIDYVTTPPLEGMHATPDLLRALCKDHAEARSALEEALANKPGNPTGKNQYASGIRVNHPNSTEKQDRRGKHLRALSDHHPDLHRRVIAGEMTVHQAAIEAGIFPRRVSVNLQSPESAAMTLFKHADRDFLAEMIKAIQSATNGGRK